MILSQTQLCYCRNLFICWYLCFLWDWQDWVLRKSEEKYNTYRFLRDLNHVIKMSLLCQKTELWKIIRPLIQQTATAVEFPERPELDPEEWMKRDRCRETERQMPWAKARTLAQEIYSLFPSMNMRNRSPISILLYEVFSRRQY